MATTLNKDLSADDYVGLVLKCGEINLAVAGTLTADASAEIETVGDGSGGEKARGDGPGGEDSRGQAQGPGGSGSSSFWSIR